MRSVDRCVCQGVIAAPKRGRMMCPLTREEYGEDYQMWYTDDPRPLTDRANWKPDILNELLERVALCGELKIMPGNFMLVCKRNASHPEFNNSLIPLVQVQSVVNP